MFANADGQFGVARWFKVRRVCNFLECICDKVVAIDVTSTDSSTMRNFVLLKKLWNLSHHGGYLAIHDGTLWSHGNMVAIDQPACHSLHDSHLEDKIRCFFSNMAFKCSMSCWARFSAGWQLLRRAATAVAAHGSGWPTVAWRRSALATHPGKVGKRKKNMVRTYIMDAGGPSC